MMDLLEATEKAAHGHLLPWLRLVHSASAKTTACAEAEVLHRVMSLDIQSIADASTAEPRAEPWHGLLATLEPHQVLRVRLLLQPEAADRTLPCIQIALLTSLADDLASTLRQPVRFALEATWPMLRFVQRREESADAAAAPPWPLRLRLVPRAAVLAQGQARSEVNDPAPVLLPYPANLPGLWLVAGGQAPLTSSPCMLELLFRSVCPDAAMRAEWEKAWRGLKQGVRHVAGAERAKPLFAHDPQLDERLATLLRHWLDSDKPGYRVEARVYAQDGLSAWAADRLVHDLFGQHPVHRLNAHALVPTSAFLHPTQGMGSWLMHPAWLARRGVPQVAVEPAALPAGPGVCLGNTYSGRPIIVPNTRRNEHTLVMGGSGAGKSSMMCRMLIEDIAAGGGVVLIDPHGDMFEQVLASIPRNRQNEVVVLDMADTQHSVAINPLEGTREDPWLRDFMSEQIVELTERLFETPQTTGPQLRNHLRHALLLAMAHPQGGLLADASRLLNDVDYRDWLLSKADSRVRSHFQSVAKTSGDYGFTNWVPYLTARLDPFVRSEPMLTTLSRPSTVSLSQVMRERGIVLIRLGRDALTETECKILGTLLLLSCFRSVLGRPGQNGSRRLEHPCQLVCDEFHLFATPAVGHLFREARKFGLGLTVATQSMASLKQLGSSALLADVMTNTGTKLFFRLSPAEASMAEEYTLPEYPARRLATLPNYQAVLSMPAEGLSPVLVKPALPRALSDVVDSGTVRELSAGRHATPMATALAFVAERHGLNE